MVIVEALFCLFFSSFHPFPLYICKTVAKQICTPYILYISTILASRKKNIFSHIFCTNFHSEFYEESSIMKRRPQNGVRRFITFIFSIFTICIFNFLPYSHHIFVTSCRCKYLFVYFFIRYSNRSG